MNIVKNVENAIKWFDNNSTSDFVYVSSHLRKPYNEVSGYFIPTLIELGMKKKAEAFADYLVSQQRKEGGWFPHGSTDIKHQLVFDAAQIVDGLTCFGTKYKDPIEKATKWIMSQKWEGKFFDPYDGSIPEHIYPRVLYCLKKAGVDTTPLNYYQKNYDFSCLSHFYAYAFEGITRMGLDNSCFVETLKKYDGKLPETPLLTTYCYTGISQSAVALFLSDEYELGMKALEFVSGCQNASGGFWGSNGKYFPREEISWAVKFYLDAVLESQRCWFRKNFHIFPDYFEGGETDSRFCFIKNNIQEGNDVLEVGSGKGRYINNISCNRHACDILDTSKFINADFKVGSALNLPYADEGFDVVFCCESMEHCLLQDKAIEECLRVLKKGGKLLIVDKDIKNQFDGVLFCEKWIDFDKLKNNYGAKIVNLSSEKLFCPFFGAIVTK